MAVLSNAQSCAIDLPNAAYGDTRQAGRRPTISYAISSLLRRCKRPRNILLLGCILCSVWIFVGERVFSFEIPAITATRRDFFTHPTKSSSSLTRSEAFRTTAAANRIIRNVHNSSFQGITVEFEYLKVKAASIRGDFLSEDEVGSYRSLSSVSEPLLFSPDLHPIAFGSSDTGMSFDSVFWGDSSAPDYSPIQGFLIRPVPGQPVLHMFGVLEPGSFADRSSGEVSLVEWAVVHYSDLLYHPSDKQYGAWKTLDSGSFTIGVSTAGGRKSRELLTGDNVVDARVDSFVDGHLAVWLKHMYANEGPASDARVQVADRIAFTFFPSPAAANAAEESNTKPGMVQSYLLRPGGPQQDVSAVTILSVGQLRYLKRMCQSWPGPISAAVEVWDDAQVAQLAAFECGKHVHFHVVRRAYPGVAVSHNQLWQVALSNCQCKLALFINVNMVPSRNLFTHLGAHVLASEWSSRKLLVVPGFRYERGNPDEVVIPESKPRLVAALRERVVVPLMNEHNMRSDAATPTSTDLNRWSKAERPYRIAYDYMYDPCFAAKVDLLPTFNSSRGGNVLARATYVYELYAAGFEFIVQASVFTVQLPNTSPSFDHEDLIRNLYLWYSGRAASDKRYGLERSVRTPPAKLGGFRDRSFFASLKAPALSFMAPGVWNDKAPDVDSGLAVWMPFDDPDNLGIDRKGRGFATVLAAPTLLDVHVNKVAWGLGLGFVDDKALIRLGKEGFWMGPVWTISVWIHLPLPPTNNIHTLAHGKDIDSVVAVHPKDHQLGVICEAGASFFGAGVNVTQFADGWHHVAAVGQMGRTAFFVDGEYRGTAKYQAFPNVYTVGNVPDGHRQFGAINDFRIYTRALNKRDIGKLYHHRVHQPPPA